MEVKFKKYGTFQDRDVLLASVFNNAVATSSLITHGLVETIKDYYSSEDYTLSVDSFSDLEKTRDVLGEALSNYIYSNNTIFKTSGDNLTTILYNAYFEFQESVYTKKVLLKYYEDIFNENPSLKTINLLTINDDRITMTSDNYTGNISLKHLNYYNEDREFGAWLNSRATDYGSSMSLPAIKYDSKGHISDYKNYEYSLPFWSDCKRVLYSGALSIDNTVDLLDNIDNFTYLILSFSADGTIFSTEPVFVPQLNTWYTVYLESLLSYDNIYNSSKIAVRKVGTYSGKTRIEVSINRQYGSTQSLTLLSVTGLVVGTD